MVLFHQFCPSTTMRRDEAILLYALLKGYKINVGKIIEKFILSYSASNYRGLIPHPATITSLCLLEGVEAKWEKEETYPRASPLTLTGVTNGIKNRGKRKEKEMEGERTSQHNGRVHSKGNKSFREAQASS